MTRVPLLYVAGAYRAAAPWLVEKNVRRAEIVAHAIWHAGAAAVCPHSMNRFFDKSVPDDLALPGVLEMLRRSDALVVLTPFASSTGTIREVCEAEALDLPILTVTLDGMDLSFESATRLVEFIEPLTKRLNEGLLVDAHAP